MRIQSTFVRFSSAAAGLALVAAVALAGNPSLSASAQAATMASTMSSGMSGTMAATMMGTPNTVPPCPTGITLPVATMMGTMAATMGTSSMATMAATMAPSMAAPAMTMAATMSNSMSATMAPTMSMAMPTMAGTSPAMTVVPGMTMNGCELTAKLTGTDEGGGKPGAVNGMGSVTMLFSHPATGTGEVCFMYQVSGITLPAIASHIHAGAAGVAGPVVIPFVGSDASGKATGCTENVPAALIDAILANPGAYYFNVHTTDFPGGAIRGQLSTVAQ